MINRPMHEQSTTPPSEYKQSKTLAGSTQGEKLVTEGASSWYNPHNGTAYKIEIYEHELRIIPPAPVQSSDRPPKRTHDDIKSFSRKSRMRVLRKFNQLQTKALSAPVFITLTSRHGNLSPKEFQYAFLKKFLPRLKEIIPNLVYAWRLEPHRDGYPHYHMFAWSWDKERNLSSQYYKRQIRDGWSEAMNDWSKAFRQYSTEIKGIRSHRKAMSYVSKYVAKEDDAEGSLIQGRRWSVSSDFPANPIAEIKGSILELHKIKKAVKRLLKSKGGRFAKVAERLDNRNEIFLWLDLDEIIWILTQVGGLHVPNSIEFYQRSGQTTPDDEFFEQYAEYM